MFSYMSMQPCLGVGIATSIRVGNELGAGNPVGAKRASYTALSITCKFDGEVRSQALHELVRLIVLNPWQSEIGARG